MFTFFPNLVNSARVELASNGSFNFGNALPKGAWTIIIFGVIIFVAFMYVTGRWGRG